jgi:Ser/Thr protein kinase RdoA (MazF antagonist)
MRTPPRELIAAAFGLSARAALVPVHFGTTQTWSLDTGDGRVLVKQLGTEDPEVIAAAMAVEDAAAAAGVDLARPLTPVRPAFGYAAHLDGYGLVRAYEWVDGRPLADSDDVAAWLGDTLARLHGLGSAPGEPLEWYRLHDPGRWQGWLAEGERRHRPWAAVLRERLPDLLRVCAWVEQGYDATDDQVWTHRDVEPWNVLMTAAGPVLVDWEGAGPDSATLEAVHAAMVFALRGHRAPDPDAVRRTLDAYRRPIPAGPAVMVRRVGISLGRLAGRLQMTLGELPAGPQDLAGLDAQAVRRIGDLPEFAVQVAGWSALLRT